MARSEAYYVELDQRSYDRAMQRLEKYEGRKFLKRMEAAYMAGARLAVAPMRREASTHSRTGLLARKVSSRKGRAPSGYFVKVGTKSRAPHAGLVAKGHRIVTPGGRDTGRRARPVPYVERTISSQEGRIIRFIKEATTNEGVSVIGMTTRF